MKMTFKNKPSIESPSKKQLQNFIKNYPKDELSPEDLQKKIDKLIEFFGKDDTIDYTKFNQELLLSNRKAYPNNDSYVHIPGQHNTQKWLNTVKDIYYKEKSGNINRVNAIRQTTSDWNIMETYDFLNWLKLNGAQIWTD